MRSEYVLGWGWAELAGLAGMAGLARLAGPAGLPGLAGWLAGKLAGWLAEGWATGPWAKR